MKNPLSNLACVWRTWRELRRFPGVFRLGDAWLQLDRVLLPDRWHFRAAGRALRREARIEELADQVHRVTLSAAELRFYWPSRPTDHLWYLIEQELDPGNPHCYTTPPIRLGPESLILDVGACEGLFAFRTARHAARRRVVCFEPNRPMAELIRRGAADNGVERQVTTESLAVGRASGRVAFEAGPSVEAGQVSANGPAATEVEAVSLDDYCRQQRLTPHPADLIKIDAEGADFEVLQGAEQLIRTGQPQIAVTTYHTDQHCFEMVEWLRQIEPRYRLRLKGFAFWTPRPRPVLLQASLAQGGGLASA